MSDILHDLYVKGIDLVVVLLVLYAGWRVGRWLTMKAVRELMFARESRGSVITRLRRWPDPVPSSRRPWPHVVHRAAERGDVAHYQHKQMHDSIPR